MICNTFFNDLLSKDNNQLGLDFTNSKDYSNNLLKPSLVYCDLVQKAIKKIYQSIETKFLENDLRQIIYNNFLNTHEPLDKHCKDNMTGTILIVFAILIKHFLKVLNCKFSKSFTKTQNFFKNWWYNLKNEF